MVPMGPCSGQCDHIVSGDTHNRISGKMSVAPSQPCRHVLFEPIKYTEVGVLPWVEPGPLGTEELDPCRICRRPWT